MIWWWNLSRNYQLTAPETSEEISGGLTEYFWSNFLGKYLNKAVENYSKVLEFFQGTYGETADETSERFPEQLLEKYSMELHEKFSKEHL